MGQEKDDNRGSSSYTANSLSEGTKRDSDLSVNTAGFRRGSEANPLHDWTQQDLLKLVENNAVDRYIAGL